MRQDDIEIEPISQIDKVRLFTNYLHSIVLCGKLKFIFQDKVKARRRLFVKQDDNEVESAAEIDKVSFIPNYFHSIV